MCVRRLLRTSPSRSCRWTRVACLALLIAKNIWASAQKVPLPDSIRGGSPLLQIHGHGKRERKKKGKRKATKEGFGNPNFRFGNLQRSSFNAVSLFSSIL